MQEDQHIHIEDPNLRAMLEDWDMEEAKVYHNHKPVEINRVPEMNIDINLNDEFEDAVPQPGRGKKVKKKKIVIRKVPINYDNIKDQMVATKL